MTRKLHLGDVILIKDKDVYNGAEMSTRSEYIIVAEYPHIYIARKKDSSREVTVNKNDLCIKDKIKIVKESIR